MPNVKSDKVEGFPGDSMVKNPPANEGDMGLIPDTARSHMLQSNQAHEPQLLSLSSRAWEQQLLKTTHPRADVLQQENPLQWGACALQLENSRHSTQLEKTVWHNEDPAQPKINKQINIITYMKESFVFFLKG